MKAANVQYQYEPLVIPEEWQEGERRFAMRLTELMDGLFQRLGQMERRLKALENSQKGTGES